jgi:hypothetical protein
VIDAETQERLQEMLRRERLSELMYVGQAFPWTPAAEAPALAAVLRLADEERQALTVLGRWLIRRHIEVDTFGSYPSHYTTINFLSLEHMLPRLLRGERASIAVLEADLAQTTDAEVRAQIDKLLFLKREHAAKLEQLCEPHSAPVSS